jgi:hypothetical protein
VSPVHPDGPSLAGFAGPKQAVALSPARPVGTGATSNLKQVFNLKRSQIFIKKIYVSRFAIQLKFLLGDYLRAMVAIEVTFSGVSRNS